MNLLLNLKIEKLFLFCALIYLVIILVLAKLFDYSYFQFEILGYNFFFPSIGFFINVLIFFSIIFLLYFCNLKIFKKRISVKSTRFHLLATFTSLLILIINILKFGIINFKNKLLSSTYMNQSGEDFFFQILLIIALLVFFISQIIFIFNLIFSIFNGEKLSSQ